MIVDAHSHWWPASISEDRKPFIAKWMCAMAGVYGLKKSPDQVLDFIAPFFGDQADEAIVARMESTGIDAAVVCFVDNPNHGLDDETLMQAIETIGAFGRRHPNKIIPFAGLNPTRDNAPDRLRRAFEYHGIRGLKWHSDVGYFWPNGPEAYRMLAVLQELGLPLLAHTGNLPRPAKAKYAHPLLFDEVLVDFPELKIIAAHTGHRWWNDWAAVAEFKSNYYGDLAEWQLINHANPHEFSHTLRQLIDITGSERILFGTDGPGFEAFVDNRMFIERVRGLVDSEHDVSFSQMEIDAILGENARRLFQL